MAIGQVQAPDMTQRTSQVRATPQNFGAGVADALKGLANAYSLNEASTDTLLAAQQRRQDQKDSFDAQRSYLDWQTGVSKQYTDMLHAAPEDAQGFTNSVHDFVQTSGADFLQTLPTRLQDKYSVKIAGMQQKTALQAYSFEYQRTNDVSLAGVAEQLKRAQSDVAMSPSSSTDRLADLQALVEASTLEAPQKQKLQIQVETAIRAAEFSGELLRVKTGQGRVEPRFEGDVHAAGLAGWERGLLNGISRPESGGDYGIMYDGGAGEHFTDFSQHPNKSHTITSGAHKGEKSTAAGRYMFIYDTWIEAKTALGLTDFSPESQDRAAIWTAKQRYARATGGKDLGAAMSSGDRELVKSAGQVLVPTWEGLGKSSMDAFANTVLGSRGVNGGPSGDAALPNPFTQPQYAGIPLADKLKMEQQAATIDATRRTQERAQATARQTAGYDNLLKEIVAQRAGEADINAMYDSGQVNLDQRTRALSLYRTENKTTVLATSAVDNMNEGLPVTQAQVNALSSKTGIYDALSAGDMSAVSDGLVPLMQSHQVLSGKAVDLLTSMLQNPVRQQFAYDALQALDKVNSGLLRPFLNAEQGRTLNHYETLRESLMDGAAVMQLMKEYTDPTTRHLRDGMREDARKLVKTIDSASILQDYNKDMRSWLPQFITGESDVQPQLDELQSRLMTSDYRELLVENLVKTNMDMDLARKMTKKDAQPSWTPTEIGGSKRFMHFAPSNYTGRPTAQAQELANGLTIPKGATMYPTVEGIGLGWVDKQVRDEYGFDADTPFQLIADGQTKTEIAKGLTPSYLIEKLDENGIPEPQEKRYVGYLSTETQAAYADHLHAARQVTDNVWQYLGVIYGPADQEPIPDFSDAVRLAKQSKTRLDELIRPNAAHKELAQRGWDDAVKKATAEVQQLPGLPWLHGEKKGFGSATIEFNRLVRERIPPGVRRDYDKYVLGGN